MSEPKGWYSRGYLPHFDGGPVPQMVTFRLAGSLPQERLEEWRFQLQHLPEEEATSEYCQRIETYLGSGIGPTWLGNVKAAACVQQALWHYDGVRYRLHAWVVMPNHVHVLITPSTGELLPSIVQNWKSFTSRECKRLLDLSGSFWQPDYFDRFIRGERHFQAAVEYIELNPVRAGLCSQAEAWRFSSAHHRSSNGCG